MTSCLNHSPAGRGRRGGVPGGVVTASVSPVAAAGPPGAVGRDPAAVDGVGVAAIHGRALTSFHHMIMNHEARNRTPNTFGVSHKFRILPLLSLCAFVLHERERDKQVVAADEIW